MRQRRLPVARPLVADALAAGDSASSPTTTRGRRRGWSGRCSRSSTPAPAEPWCRRSAAPRPPSRRRSRAPATARRSPSPRSSPACSTSYAAQRPSMLRAWARRRDDRRYGSPLDADLRWQAELWRRLRAHDRRRRARPSGSTSVSPALRADPALVDLPERLSLFGPTRLTAGPARSARRAGRAPRRAPLAAAPVPGLWQRVADGRGRSGARRTGATTRRSTLPDTRCSPPGPRRPRAAAAAAAAPARRRRRTTPVARTPDTLLGRLQRDLRDDRVAGRRPRCSAADDRSRPGARLPRPAPAGRGAARGRRSACSPTTRRSSRATCSSCARTSRRSRRSSRRRSGSIDERRTTPRTRATGSRVRLADRALRQTNPLLDVARPRCSSSPTPG